MENLINRVIKLHRDKIVRPLFANLHAEVSKDEAIWDKDGIHLVERHADKRKNLIEQLQELEKIVDGLEEMISWFPNDSSGGIHDDVAHTEAEKSPVNHKMVPESCLMSPNIRFNEVDSAGENIGTYFKDNHERLCYLHFPEFC